MKNYLTVRDAAIPYQVVSARNRKHVQLAFNSAGILIIRVPLFITRRELDVLLENESERIFRLREKYLARTASPVNSDFQEGAPFLYLGHPYYLNLRPAERNQVYVDGSSLIIQYEPVPNEPSLAVAGRLLCGWYAVQSRSALLSRTAHWAKQIGVTPTKVAIRDQRTRWGSCSGRGAIHYSWRLIMSPSSVMDYVVVHELCHLRQPNHSQAFWDLVAAHVPDYSDRRRWLKDNGHMLMRFTVP